MKRLPDTPNQKHKLSKASPHRRITVCLYFIGSSLFLLFESLLSFLFFFLFALVLSQTTSNTGLSAKALIYHGCRSAVYLWNHTCTNRYATKWWIYFLDPSGGLGKEFRDIQGLHQSMLSTPDGPVEFHEDIVGHPRHPIIHGLAVLHL